MKGNIEIQELEDALLDLSECALAYDGSDGLHALKMLGASKNYELIKDSINRSRARAGHPTIHEPIYKPRIK